MEGSPEALSGQLEVRYKDRGGKTRADCNAEGMKTEFGGLEGLALQAGGVESKVLSSEGLLMPPADQMTAGKAWKNKIEMEVTPPKLGVTFQTTFEKESIVIGPDRVTVAAGTFDALKLLNKTTASSGSVGMERAVESFMWVAPGVGIIKLQTGNSVDLELLSIETAPKPAAAPAPGPKKRPAKAKKATGVSVQPQARVD